MKQIRQLSKKGILPMLAIAILYPLVMGAFHQSYLILLGSYAMLYIIVVSGIDVLFGYSGQITMGHAGFYAIGAYGTAIIHNYLNLPPMLSILAACLIAAAVSVVIALPASKLVFHFLSLATIAFGEIIYQLICHSPGNITGNFVGIFTDGFSLFGLPISTPTAMYFFGLFWVAVFLLAKQRIVNSKFGREFIAIRENPHSANGMGINVRKYKVLAFVISAVFTSFAGAFYSHLVGYVSPDTFVRKQSVMFVTMLLFGGSASVGGTITGVIFVLILTELLRALQDYQMVIYGVLMLVAIVALPGGLYGGIRQLLDQLRSRADQRKEAHVHAER